MWDDWDYGYDVSWEDLETLQERQRRFAEEAVELFEDETIELEEMKEDHDRMEHTDN